MQLLSEFYGPFTAQKVPSSVNKSPEDWKFAGQEKLQTLRSFRHLYFVTYLRAVCLLMLILRFQTGTRISIWRKECAFRLTTI